MYPERGSQHSGYIDRDFLTTIMTCVTVVVVMMALMYPLFLQSKESNRGPIAMHVVNRLAVSINMYYTEYGKYPDLGTRGGDTQIINGNAHLMKILMGQETESPIQNKLHLNFFTYKVAKGRSKPRDGMDTFGNLLDPWGRPYRIIYDSNFDNHVFVYGEDTAQNAVVWSPGPDGVEAPNVAAMRKSDDIVSFKYLKIRP